MQCPLDEREGHEVYLAPAGDGTMGHAGRRTCSPEVVLTFERLEPPLAPARGIVDGTIGRRSPSCSRALSSAKLQGPFLAGRVMQTDLPIRPEIRLRLHEIVTVV